MGVSHGSPSGVNDPTQGPETVPIPHPTLPMAGSAVYGITLFVLALAGLWTAFVIVACIGGPLDRRDVLARVPVGPRAACGNLIQRLNWPSAW